MLRSVGEIRFMLGVIKLCALYRMEEELPSASDVAEANNIKLQEITENTAKSTDDLIAQFEEQETLPMCELLGLDKQLRSLRGSLKVETVKKVQLKECIKREKHKLAVIQDNPGYDDGIREDIKKQIAELSDDLSVRQESIDILKDRLTN